MADPDDAIVELEDVVARWSEESFTIDDETLAAVLLGANDATWIPLGEAEEAAGVSRSTLRAWYRSGRIPSRLVPGPHGLQRLVPREAVLDQAARSPRAGGRSEPNPDAGTSSKEPSPAPAGGSDVARLAELAISEARERTAAAEARAAAAEERAAAAEAALRAALERAAAAEAEVRVLRERERRGSAS